MENLYVTPPKLLQPMCSAPRRGEIIGLGLKSVSDNTAVAIGKHYEGQTWLVLTTAGFTALVLEDAFSGWCPYDDVRLSVPEFMT